MMLRHVDLCSGIGGFSLGFHWAELSKPILFCDTEEWCRKILAKNFPNVPIAKDVKELANDPERLVPDHDILSCGYPCQPFSVAGLRKAEKDDRHIWPSIFRIIAQKRPSWVVCENVYGHIALGLDKVLLDLESEEYATRTFVVPACAKNAPHRRDRLWIIAKNVGDTEYNGSSSTKIRRGNEENAGGSQKGEIQTEQFEGTSGRENHATLADSECLGWFERSEEQEEFNREGSSDKLNFSSEGRTRSRTSSSMADTNCEPSRGGGIFEQTNDQKRRASQERGESIQSRNRSTRTSNIEQSSKNVADTNGERLQGSEETRNIEECRTDSNQFSTRHGGTSDVADTNCQRTSRRSTNGKDAKDVRQSSRFGEDKNIWFVEPNVGRVAHGIPKRVDRLKGLGNAIVPQIAMQIGLAIKNELS